ncbi:uncharacterized protein E0L32_011896 [Thyridium curvatum]|uniref:Uncharacterized protein n=1 Tax=Thyridium curvatum TaxID=1093900 RepID=A0A507BMR3_9PEZI|nr:uncharacterized protein E0L32_011896 [Thyridium curvatum]TPX18030.1 hypothetical protein E0L32_011896 [Thyridium curvatum]
MNPSSCGECEIQVVAFGLDFGDTHSGVAMETKPACKRHVTAAGYQSVTHVPKFRTVLHFDAEEDKLTFVPPGKSPPANTKELSLQCLKHHLMCSGRAGTLLDDPDLLKHVERASNFPRSRFTSSEKVGIFLRGMWEIALQQQASLGLSANTKVRRLAIITYPALWDNDETGTLQRFEDAVEYAGIFKDAYDVVFCSEHQAASNSIARDYGQLWPRMVEDGQPVIMVDCGGITIDAGVYIYQRDSRNISLLKAYSVLTGPKAADVAFGIRLDAKLKKKGVDLNDISQREKAPALRFWDSKKEVFGIGEIEGACFNIAEHTIHFHSDEFILIFRSASNRVSEMIVELCKEVEAVDHKPIVFFTGGTLCGTYVQWMVELDINQKLGDRRPKLVFGEAGQMREKPFPS